MDENRKSQPKTQSKGDGSRRTSCFSRHYSQITKRYPPTSAEVPLSNQSKRDKQRRRRFTHSQYLSLLPYSPVMSFTFLQVDLPVYEGRDPNLNESNYCMMCFKKNGDSASSTEQDGTKDSIVQLMRCGGGRCAYFCSVKCQGDAWTRHKKACNAIKKGGNQVGTRS